jgi:hypothetical protein
MSTPSGGVSYAAAAASSSSSGVINNGPPGNLEAAIRMQQEQQREQMQRLWKGTGATHSSSSSCPPTAFTLRAALLLLQPAAAGDTVYLMDADYLQNWLVWAMHQAVPPAEARRVREALRLAALAQGLVPPPIADTTTTGNSNDSSNSINNNNHNNSVTQEEAAYYNEYYGSYMEPGPVDATALSVEGHPLVLQPTVRVMRKQHATNTSDHPHHHYHHHHKDQISNSSSMTAARLQHHLQLIEQQQAPDSPTHAYGSSLQQQSQQPQQHSHHRRILSSVGYGGRDDNSTAGGTNTSEAAATYSEAGAATISPSSNNNNMSMLANNMLNFNMNNNNAAAMHVEECLVVPEAFYEALRGVHGVLCEDGYSVSYQPGEREAHLLHHQIHCRKQQAQQQQQQRQQQEAVSIEHHHNNDPHHHHHHQNEGGGVEALEEQQHNGTANGSNGTHYHHHHHPYHNGSSSRNSSSPRPIEFRRKVIWQILPPRLPLPPAPPPTSAETAQSVAAMLMQKANLFKNKNKNGNKNKQGDANEVSLMDKLLHQEELRKQPMRIPVPEIHPIKLQYRILTDRHRPPTYYDTTAAAALPIPTTTNNTAPLRSAGSSESHAHDCLLRPTDGFALVSKESTAVDALAALLRAAQPQAATQTVRLWCKRSFITSGQQHNRNGVAPVLPPLGTTRGDAYELVDLNDLTVDRAKTATEYISSGASVSSAASAANEPLVVADWVLRQVVPKRPDDNISNNINTISKNNNVNQINEVECLIECRSTVNAPWPRHGMELENRVSVGDFVDAQDVAGKWYEAVVLAVDGDYDDNASKSSTRSKNTAAAAVVDDNTKDTVTVHYLGWASRWNAVLKRHKHAIIPGPANKLKPIAPLWSRTRAWREQIRVGDIVEVRDSSSIVERPKWYRGVVKKVGRPNDAAREIVGGADLEVFPASLTSRHLPDLAPDKKTSSSRKEPLLLLARTQQILVEVDQEKVSEFFSCSQCLPDCSLRICLNATD